MMPEGHPPWTSRNGTNGRGSSRIRLSLTPLGIQLRSRAGGLTRRRGRDDPETIAAVRAYRTEVLAEHVRRTLATPPSLTEEQRSELADILLRSA